MTGMHWTVKSCLPLPFYNPVTKSCSILPHLKPPCQNYQARTPLVVRWLRIRLPMQGTQVRSLLQGDPYAAEQQSLGTTAAEPVR